MDIIYIILGHYYLNGNRNHAKWWQIPEKVTYIKPFSRRKNFYFVALGCFSFNWICFRNSFSSFRKDDKEIFTTHLKFSLTGLQKFWKDYPLWRKCVSYNYHIRKLYGKHFLFKKILKSVSSVTILLNCFQKAAKIVSIFISFNFKKCMKIVLQAISPYTWCMELYDNDFCCMELYDKHFRCMEVNPGCYSYTFINGTYDIELIKWFYFLKFIKLWVIP